MLKYIFSVSDRRRLNANSELQKSLMLRIYIRISVPGEIQCSKGMPKNAGVKRGRNLVSSMAILLSKWSKHYRGINDKIREVFDC